MTLASRPGPFHRLSLGMKLGIGFAVLTILSTMLGLFALERLGTTNGAVVVLRDNYLPSTLSGARLQLALEEVHSSEARMMMTTSDAERAEAELSVRNAIADVNRRRAEYDSLIDPGEERDRFTTVFNTTWPKYQADLAQLQTFKDDRQDKEAHERYVGASASHLKALIDLMQWDLGYNAQHGEAYGELSRQSYSTARALIATGIGLVLLLSTVIAVALIRHISRPITAMTAAMRRLADRDMTVPVPGIGRGDEIGAMASAVQVFKESMITADRLSAEQEAERTTRQQRSTRLETLMGDFERQIGSTVSMLAAASTEMEATASSMTGTAAQTDRQAVAVAQAAEVSSAGVQTVAAASEQLSSSISEINRQVVSSATLTGKVIGSVRRTDDTVQALSESAARIGKVVELITSIASQTNLLALNATIEAARAGDAGKGFAVVASEVKSLAQQTARATDEIAGQIAQVQQATGGAVDAIREIGGLIEEVGAITTSIAAAVEQQGAATAEIARNVQQTAVSTQVVTSNIAGVSRAANDTGAAAGEVLSAAGDLSRQAESLSSEVNSFISKVRTA